MSAGFAHGVASGDPAPDGAVVWTRFKGSDAPVPVDWVVTDIADRVVAKGTLLAEPAHDWTVRRPVTGLGADTQYRYQFFAGGIESRVGSFRTLPIAARAVRFAAICCAKYNAGYFNAYAALARRDDLDFVLCLGDYIYEAANHPPASQTPGAGIGRDFVPDHECRSLADYRSRYAQYRTDPALQDLHAAHAVVATIDDHELADNAWSGGAEEHREKEHGPWATRLHAAMRAWEEWVPSRVRPASRNDEIYRAFVLPGAVTIALCETRRHRTSPHHPHRASRTELGREQRRWLHDLVAGCSTPWLILGMPSVLSPLWQATLDADAEAALRALKLTEATRHRPFHDLWDAYPSERAAVVAALRDTQARPIVLSGDVHVALEMQIYDGDSAVATEWTVPSVTSQNLDDKKGWPPHTASRRYEAALCAAVPHLEWCDLDGHGYVVVDVGDDCARAEWWFVDTVLTPSDRVHRAHTAAAL